jgi:hypothetical protein
VADNSSHGVYLDIWRNAGYWEVFDYVYPYEGRNIYSNDIDRIRIEC